MDDKKERKEKKKRLIKTLAVHYSEADVIAQRNKLISLCITIGASH